MLNKFTRALHGGFEQAEAALLAHEALLIPGRAVRVYRGDNAGFVGVVLEGEAPIRRGVLVSDGVQTIPEETKNLEIVQA